MRGRPRTLLEGTLTLRRLKKKKSRGVPKKKLRLVWRRGKNGVWSSNDRRRSL